MMEVLDGNCYTKWSKMFVLRCSVIYLFFFNEKTCQKFADGSKIPRIEINVMPSCGNNYFEVTKNIFSLCFTSWNTAQVFLSLLL